MHDVYSKRNKKPPDILQCDVLPRGLLVQLLHIWRDAIGEYDERTFTSPPQQNGVWEKICSVIAKEHCLLSLGDRQLNPYRQCQQFLFNNPLEPVLDLIEASLRTIDVIVRKWGVVTRAQAGLTQSPTDAIQEFNARCLQHGVGYQYVGRKLIRCDSQFIHTKVVVPAVELLHQNQFRGPSEEFMNAHEHYRKGRQKEAIVDALKAFESTMKAICDARTWAYAANSTASKLIEVVLANGLVPKYLQDHLTGLRKVLEAGVPTVRNKSSCHGQGAQPTPVPQHLAAYALHMTAANIVLLVEAHNAMP